MKKVLVSCAILLFACHLLVGPLGMGDLIDGFRFIFTGAGNEVAGAILWGLRLPRLVLGILCGISLGLSGAAYQALFRNALADPFVIGSASGAALGAGLAMLVSLPAPPAAFVGSLGAVLGAWLIAGGHQPVVLLLAGTSIGSLCSSLLSLLLIVQDGTPQRVYYWLLGSLSGASWQSIAIISPFSAVGCLILVLAAPALDLMSQGDDTALSLGLDVKKFRLLVIIGASLAASGVVAGAGVLGFVGLAAPHMARTIVGPAHRKLLPLSALLGVIFVLGADLLSRISCPPIEIPIGILTALGGLPFFLYLISKWKRQNTIN